MSNLEYEIVSGEYPQQLKSKIRTLVAKGDWKPQGGVVVIEYQREGIMYYQAMVRRSLAMDEEEVEKVTDQEMQVVEIHSDCKYALILEGELSMDEQREMTDRLCEWWENDKPFLIAHGCKLVKVRDDKEN